MIRGGDERLAVVDVGSNSTRLLLCRTIGPRGPEGQRLSTITALRRGAARDGSVAVDALARLESVLSDYRRRIDEFAPAQTVAIGTSAVRDAPNRAAVERLVERLLGVPLAVISGEREAELAFRGARLALEDDDPAMVIDVGGGSTELVRGGPDGPDGRISLRLGAVRCTDALLHHDPPLPEELAALRAEAERQVRGALEAIGGPARAVGVAGSACSLGGIHLGGYDPALVHRLRLPTATIAGIAARLAATPLARLLQLPGLEPGRAPAIVAGTTLIATILEVAGLEEMLVSERDLLEGAALAVADGSLVSDVTIS